jgi:hypothetical protein
MSGYLVGENFARQLRELVGGARVMQSGKNPIRFDEIQTNRPSSGGSTVYEATFSGAWQKGQSKAVNINTSATTTTTTIVAVDVVNRLSSVMPGLADRTCIVLKKPDGTWTLVNAEC